MVPATYLGKKTVSGVWSNICKAIRSTKLHNIDPYGLFGLVPGQNIDILFWKDIWCGDVTLQNRFPLLYNLESVKKCYLMDRLCNNGFSWNWKSTLIPSRTP
uniref:Reverse transcriptase zinc-binding domain-containing protein n=1 Tax=Lactuca sativa TaxID=4236 RepID=A0A9R1WBR8_LACSA|nr:hypothetical protein LSAT_V11C200085580 [Lactuca sativa]